MLILQIRAFWPIICLDLLRRGYKGGVTGAPGPHPGYTLEEEKYNLALASLRPP